MGSPGPKVTQVAAGSDAILPIPSSAFKRQLALTLSRHRASAYCAHAPEPYAAMASRGDWSTELWDIFAQPGGTNMCCLSLWCPCVQYGLLMEQLPPGSVTCAGSAAGGCALFCALWLLGDLLGAVLLTKVITLPCTALIHTHMRGYIRQKYGIQSHPLHDFFITWCCAPCALCQEAREAVIRQAAEREGSTRSLPPSRNGSIINSPDTSGRSQPLAGARSAPTLPAAGAGSGPGMATVSSLGTEEQLLSAAAHAAANGVAPHPAAAPLAKVDSAGPAATAASVQTGVLVQAISAPGSSAAGATPSPTRESQPAPEPR